MKILLQMNTKFSALWSRPWNKEIQDGMYLQKTFLHKINCSFTKYVLYSFCLHYRYGQLTAGLTQDNVKAVQEVFKLCEQRQAAKRSKSIEQAGGKYKKFAIKISFYTESWLEKFIQIFFFFIQMKNECMHAY